MRASKSNNRGSTSTARRLERDKVMQVRGLRGSENLVSTGLGNNEASRRVESLGTTFVYDYSSLLVTDTP